MSSEEDDEFFDAPEAFGANTNKPRWSDSDEDISTMGAAALDHESKNARRRDKVESLKRSLDDSIGVSAPVVPNRLNQSVSREETPRLMDAGPTSSHHYATDSRVSMILAGGDPSQPRVGGEASRWPPVEGVMALVKQAGAVSAPECRLPPPVSLQALDYVKSWSLDTARIHHKMELDGSALEHSGQPVSGAQTVAMRKGVVSRVLQRMSSAYGRNTAAGETPPVSALSPVAMVTPAGMTTGVARLDNGGPGPGRSPSMDPESPDPLARTESGHVVSEEEVLAGVCVTNLDTGEQVPLSQLESTLGPGEDSPELGPRSHLPQHYHTLPPLSTLDSTLNPIQAQFRERTKSNSSLQRSEDSDRLRDSSELGAKLSGALNGKFKKLQKNFRGAFSAMKSATRAKIFHPDEESSDEDEELVGNRGIRLRSSRRMKGRRDFLQVKLVQEMKNDHTGAVWAMRFSPCGRLLATAGYDRNIRIWVLRQYYRYFKQMQKNTGENDDCTGATISAMSAMATREEEWLLDSASMVSASASTGKTDEGSTCSSGEDDLEHSRKTPFRSRPLLVWRGHEGVVTDLAWSKNLFLLATSMDRQVRLWHISRHECLCIFSHNDTVPTIVFHPKDDRYFLSGSLDGKLRLWHIPDKKVRFWVEAPLPSTMPASALVRGGPEPKTVITCAAFACDGTKVAVGTYDGRVMFFNTELVYIASITIKNHHGNMRHCRVTAIEIDPIDTNKILVTSNDSRIRLIDARDYHTLCKYRGFENSTSQIKATFSNTGKYIISGSENHFFYVWKKSPEVNRVSRFSTARKDRNNCWEAIKAHEAVVTVALFCPNPVLILDKRLRRQPYLYGTDLSLSPAHTRQEYLGEVIVSADCNGCIRVFKNRMHVT